MNYIPFTYLIGWSEHDIWYYGRRTAKKCHPSDLWKIYFTSSKLVKAFREQHGEPDIIEVRKTFDDSKDCTRWESKVLQRIDAQHDFRFLNQRNSDEKWDTSGLPIPDYVLEKRIASARGKAAAKDSFTGESLGRISLSDPRWQTGEIVGITKGRVFGPPSEERVAQNKIIQDSLVAANTHYWLSDEHKKKTGERNKRLIEESNHPFAISLTCPHCGKRGQKTAMIRWHFDRCRHLRINATSIASSLLNIGESPALM